MGDFKPNFSEAAIGNVLQKLVFLEILHILQENTCVGVCIFNKVAVNIYVFRNISELIYFNIKRS